MILQRRAIRFVVAKNKGEEIKLEDIQFQRPCPDDAISINDFSQIIGKKLSRKKDSGDYIKKEDIVW